MTRSNPRTSFQIGTRRIAESAPAFIIAEIGINHNGSVERAKALIDAAVDAGVDAVKFQKRELQSIYQEKVLSKLEEFEQGFQYLIPLLKEFELSDDEFVELKKYCDAREILFLCTPFDSESAHFVNSLGVEAFKISSADLTNMPLLREISSFGKPMILSTGMSEDAEIDYTVSFLEKRAIDFALLHCVSSYPVDPRDARMRRIQKLKSRYDCPIGYSGHDLGTALSISARTLGACIIEKHVTLDRSMRGPDHKLSLLPEELCDLVRGIRDVEAALADRKEQMLPAEMLNQLVFRKSLAAAMPISKGAVITEEMLAVKSPGSGLGVQAMSKLVGRVIQRDMAVDDLFLPSDIEGTTQSGGKPTYIPWGKWGFVVRYHDFEEVLQHEPEVLEFHLTYQDTLLDIPFARFAAHRDVLKKMTLRVHCCEYIGEELFDLLSTSEEIRLKSQQTLQRVIDITAELSPYFAAEKPMIVFNCGAMMLKESVVSAALEPDLLIEGIERLDLKNTHLLAQNMPPNPFYFGGQWKGRYFIQAEELIEFCKQTNQSICLDLSHAYMACEGEGMNFIEYIEKLKPYVKHVHLSDARSCEGEGIQIGQGEIDFEAFFRCYAEYSGTWIPEVWLGHVNGNKGALAAIERLSALFRNSGAHSLRDEGEARPETEKKESFSSQKENGYHAPSTASSVDTELHGARTAFSKSQL